VILQVGSVFAYGSARAVSDEIGRGAVVITGVGHLASCIQPVVDPVSPAAGADSFVARVVPQARSQPANPRSWSSIQPAHANSRRTSNCGRSASSLATAAVYASTSPSL
jgi:hypothetical protein